MTESTVLTVRRSVMFGVGCLSSAWSFAIVAFSAYAIALRMQFGYSQTELSLIAGMMALGLVFAVPAGVMMEKYGPRKTSAWSHLATLGYLLMWSAFLDKEFYEDKAYLFALYALLGGAGGATMFTIAIAANMANFRPQHYGIVNGVIQMACTIGIFIIVASYQLGFSGGYFVRQWLQDLQGYFLMMTIVFAIINTLAIIFNGHYPQEPIIVEEDTKSEEIGSPNGEVLPLCISQETKSTAKDNNWSFIVNPQFLCVFFAFSIVMGAEMAFVINITVMLVSFVLERYALVATLLGPIVQTVCQPVIGYISDKTTHWISRSIFVLVPTALLAVLNFFGIWYINNIGYFLVVLVCYQLAVSSTATLLPVLAIQFCGEKNFPRMMGMLCVGYAVMFFVLVFIFAYVYESNIERVGYAYCFGIKCVQAYFALAAALAVVCCVLVLVLWHKERNIAFSEK